MTVGLVGQQKQDDGGGFVVLSSPPPLPTTIMPSSAPVSSSSPPDYLNRVVSDDERSDHSGYRKPIPPQPQQQQNLPWSLSRTSCSDTLWNPHQVSRKRCYSQTTRFSTRENPPPSPPSLAPPLSAATSTHPAAAHYSQGYIGHIMSMLQVSS
ncbi:hypothetical protein ACLB2K_021097 [Fragaria x ananassa]